MDRGLVLDPARGAVRPACGRYGGAYELGQEAGDPPAVPAELAGFDAEAGARLWATKAEEFIEMCRQERPSFPAFTALPPTQRVHNRLFKNIVIKNYFPFARIALAVPLRS